MRKKNTRETTFRFPFDIDTRYFLALAIFFFVLSIKPVNELFFSTLTIPKLKEKIELSTNNNIKLFTEITNDTQLVKQIFTQTLSANSLQRLTNIKYNLYFYSNHELIFWNTIITKNPIDTFKPNTPIPYKDTNGYYIAYQCNIPSNDGHKSMVALFKIKNDNGIENKYFAKNFLVHDAENDFNLELSFDKVPKSEPIIVNGITQFYIYKNEDFLTVNDKNGWRLFFSALPFIFFGVSIHTYYKVEIKKKNVQFIFTLLLATIFLLRISTYCWGFPINFEQFGLFSPEYFASDFINKSLGDVFINMCLMFWALLFYIINVQGKVYNLKTNKFRAVIGITIFIICMTTILYLSNLVYRITRDSIVNFDTTLFYKLDLFSFMGILTFMVIFVNIFCLSIISRNYLFECYDNLFLKYIFILILYIIFYAFGFEFNDGIHYYLVFICIAALYLLQDFNYLKIKFDFNSYKLLIWLLFLSGTGSFFLKLLIDKQEHVKRENYAESLLEKDDNDLIESLHEKVTMLELDNGLQKLLNQNKPDANVIANYIVTNHFKHEHNYSISVDATPHIVLPKHDSATVDGISNKVIPFLEVENKGFRLYPTIYFTNNDSITLLLKMDKKRGKAMNEYADLLLSKHTSDLIMNDLYSYAIYTNSILTEQKGEHFFSYKLQDENSKFDTRNKMYFNKNGHDELWLQNDTGTCKVAMAKDKNSMFLFTTLFAYIFFIYFVTITLYIVGNIIARSNLNYKRFINLLSINLRLRIHFSILAVELCSFIVIGYFTSYFLIERVNEKMKKELSKYNYTIQQEVKNMSNGNNKEFVRLKPDSLANSVTEMMKTISERYSINMNVYSIEKGKLMFSSLPELYTRNTLSDRIQPNIFFTIKQGIHNNIINNENIGLLKFLSSYFLIRNAVGDIIGIVQLPFFLSSAEIKSETTTIIITLINVYIFVFLISAIIAFFLTKSVTRPFTYIVKQFTKINLSKTNEPLKWFDSDEIGLLIKEYNRMLRKLENSTVLLAKREREDAWREMAKQVAHEIKNPLTPMKLSLQMLERAIKNNATNVNETAIKVTKTLVEQIDNLSLIATNFSNFAKLPVSKNEVFFLNEFLYLVTGMYHDDYNNEFLFIVPDYEIELYADKSQIMRVFTNVIQNAIQAIPEDRKGNIALTVSKIKNNQIRISISDNGDGISEEQGKNLFQPYFTTKTSGTGLGLAMCKDIIEDSGGKISFESILGEGTVFHIDLPIHVSE